MESYSDRLVTRWQDSNDDDERDIVFTRLVRHCMRLPVVRKARRQTFTSVASHSPRWAEEEEQAIRRAIWRSAQRWNPTRGVPFDAYVSSGLRVAIHDFWRQDAWIQDLSVHVPVSDWKHYRKLMASRPHGMMGRPDECPLDLWSACTPPFYEGVGDTLLWDDYDDDEEVL